MEDMQMLHRRLWTALCLSTALAPLVAQAEGPVAPPITFLTWPAASYQHYYETSNYIAESWRELGLEVTLNPQPFPAPMLGMWFTEREFDVVMSVLSGSPARLDPEFFTVTQFIDATSVPGGMNVGGFHSEELEELHAEQRRLYDPEARREVIHRIQELLHDEQPEGLIASVVNTMAINTNVAHLDDYRDSPDGVRSIWNLIRLEPAGDATDVRLGWTIDQDSWNPLALRTLEDLDRVSLIYDRLVVTGPDGRPEMWAATEIEVVDDTTIDVRLRDDLVFNDGAPVTAEDVAFSFRFLKENSAVYFRSVLESLTDAQATDEGVRFTLTGPSASFVSQALGQIPILPQHVWSEMEDPASHPNTEPVGSGPYNLAYWRQGQEISFTRNEDHFMEPRADLLMIQYGSAEVLAAGLRRGEIGVSLQPIVPTVVDLFETEEHLQLIRAQSNGHMSARYNVEHPLLAHKAVRQALSYAIPRQQIIQDILNDDAVAIATPLVPVNAFWSHPDLEVQAYDLERARAILSDAGFSWDDTGRLRMPD